MTYQQLKQLVESKGFVFFDKGNYNLNFIWLRHDMIADNHFTDVLYIAYKVNGLEKVLTVQCTTLPGLRGSLYNPNTVRGITGTAVIQTGQYRGAWKFIDSYTKFSKYPFFMQIKPLRYWRDGNKDNVIDEVNPETAINGTHWHKMSNLGDKRKIEKFEVNNWSQGCMGCPISEWDKVIEVTREAIQAGQSGIFTGTIVRV